VTKPIRVSTEIDAAPGVVWSAIEPIERHVDWMADAVAIRFLTDQTRGAGTRFVCDTRVGPIRLHDTMQITAWEPGRTMGVTHDGLVSGSGEFTLDELDGGTRTRFTWTEQLHFPWQLGGSLGARLGRPVMTAIWKRNLRNLTRLVEQAR
jgi:uncharacterized protein YndB with AHSA1/START domain